MKKYLLVPVISLVNATCFIVGIIENDQHTGFIKENNGGNPYFKEETPEINESHQWATATQVLEWAASQNITIWGKLKIEMYWKTTPQFIEESSILSNSPQEMEEIIRKVIAVIHPSLKPKPNSIIKAGISARYLSIYPIFIPLWSFKYCPDGRVIYQETIF